MRDHCTDPAKAGPRRRLPGPFLLLRALQSRPGITFCDPDQTSAVRRTSDGFVDDIVKWINRFLASLRGDNDIAQITSKLRAIAQQWEELLFSSGGALELSKCFYYLIKWDFDIKANPILQPTTIPISITSSVSGAVVPIQQKECTEAHKTLGVMLSPDCSSIAEIKRLATKARTLAHQIAKASLSRRQSLMVTRSIFFGRLQYGLSVSTMPMKEYHAIQSPVNQAILPKLGYNQHTHLAVVYGPPDLGGIGLPDLYAIQGTKKVMSIVEHLRCNSTLGRHLRMMVGWTQQLTGVGFNILRFPERLLPPSAGDTWIRGVRRFLSDSNCQLLIQGWRVPQPRRQNDITIMDLALSSGLSKASLQSIQKVRLYLQITFLSDAYNAEGTAVLTEIKQNQAITVSTPNELYPRQAKPPAKDWNEFFRLLKNHKRVLGPWKPTWHKAQTWTIVRPPTLTGEVPSNGYNLTNRQYEGDT